MHHHLAGCQPPLPAGTAAGGDPAVTWSSVDGRIWDRSETDLPGLADGEVIEFASGIARHDDTVVIAGDLDVSGAEFGHLGWFSWVGKTEP